jgi:cytochrome c551/c552
MNFRLRTLVQMKSVSIFGLAIFSLAMARGQTAVERTDTTMPLAAQQALVTKYCAGCHNDKLKSGGFSWTKINLAHVDAKAEQTEKAILKLRAGMMPPAGAPRPDAATIKQFATSLENGIDQVAGAHPNPGIAPALHRLNRTEYRNSVRDLLDLDVDVTALLPPDDSSHGFDNMADVLTVSPALMEGYIRAAGKISRLAVGDPSVGPVEKTYHIPRVINQTRHVEDTPIGTRGGISVVHNFPADGEYTFKVSFYDSLDGPLYGKNQGKSQQIEFSVNGARVALLQINPNMKLTDYPTTPPIAIKAGPQRVSAAFIQHFEGPVEDIVSPPELSLVDLNNADMPGMTSLPHLREFSITGPTKVTGVSETPARARIFTCRPAAGADEIPCARTILAALARQAFRRPSTGSDDERLLSYFQRGRNDGDFDSGIRTAMQAIIADPEFVFRFERMPANAAPGTNYRIDDLELASRLSYFLWSSAPDDTLITLASERKLQDQATLEQQVRRMLADPKAESLAANFAGQWLHLQNLKDAQPDAFLYPNFDRNLVESMRRETELLFMSILRENRNVLDLLTASYTFVDELLAKEYGIPNVLGSRFRRVEISDPNRFGLLGQASILTVTSIANRTSPVARGKYVMEVLLGAPPPPPLPNVPALKENSEITKALSVRERLEEHRKNAVCATCHKMMDPIGFSLENFDAMGAWRTKDSGFPVDASGKMFDGTKLDGPVSLRQAILSHSDAFLGTFSQNLLAYALGRVVDYRDMPAVRAIEKDAAKDDNRFPAFVLGIVRSAPFQMRRAEQVESASVDETRH